MPLVPLEIPAGMVRKGSTYSQMGRWRDGNFVRFMGKTVAPIGGWAVLTQTTVANAPMTIRGTVRSFHSWRDNLGRTWTAIGSTGGLYVYDGAHIRDITPVGITLPGESVGGLYGYSTGFYGTEKYNEPVGDQADTSPGDSGTAIEYGYWHLTNWGDHLVASIGSDGDVFEWDPHAPDVLPLRIPNSPQFARGVAATDERHLVIVGAKIDMGLGSFAPAPRRVQWSNVEDNTDWAATAVNLAGENDLNTAGNVVRILRFRKETLILTDIDIHRMVFQGYPLGYTFERIASDCGLANPGAVAASANMLFWVGPRGFFYYDGNQVNAIASDLFNTPDEVGAVARTGKTVVGHNSLFNEFIVFYSSNPTDDPNRYILFNYAQGWWADGGLARSGWHDAYLRALPMAAESYMSSDPTPVPLTRLYLHETGADRPNVPVNDEFIRSAPIEIGKGDQFVTVQQLIQDTDDPGQRLRFGFTFKRSPQGPIIKEIIDSVPDPARGYSDVRGCGRQVELKISADQTSIGAWKVGNWRIDAFPGDGR